MAPNKKQKQAYVVTEIDYDGTTNLVEACTTQDIANIVVDRLKAEGKMDVEIMTIPLDLSAPVKVKTGTGKTTTASKKRKEKSDDRIGSEADEDEDEGKKKAKKVRDVIPEGVEGSLSGMKVFITGTMECNRATMQTTIGKYGGSNTKKMEDADLIVVGTKPGENKVKEMEEKGLSTITEEEFLMRIRGEAKGAPPKKKLKS